MSATSKLVFTFSVGQIIIFKSSYFSWALPSCMQNSATFLPPHQLQALQRVASELAMRMLGMEIVVGKELELRAALMAVTRGLQAGQHRVPPAGQLLAQPTVPPVSCLTSTSLYPGNKDLRVWSRYSRHMQFKGEGYSCTLGFKLASIGRLQLS